MERFTVEESNLICIYLFNTCAELISEMAEALPYMDEEMRELANHTFAKLRAMTDAEFAAQAFDFTDDDAGKWSFFTDDAGRVR